MKTKVLHIIKTLDLGGAEVNLLNLVQAFDKKRFEHHVAYSSGGEIEKIFRKNQITLYKFASKNYRVKSPATFPIVFKLARYLRKNNIRIIHTHNFSAHIWGILAGKIARAKVIEHVHDFRYMDPDDFRKRRGFNKQYRFIRLFRKLSDRVIVLTQQNRDFLVQNSLYPPENVRIILNGIPFTNTDKPSDKDMQITRNDLRIDENKKIILTTARMAPEKNIDLILRLAPVVVKKYPQALFLIAGSGPLLNKFREQVHAKNMDSFVKFPGFQKDTYRLLTLARVFLLPSFLELHSIALLEAMLKKVPVVISRNVGSHDSFIRHQDNGFLHDPFSDTGWAESIIQLLQDDVTAKRMAERAYQYCKENFDISETVKDLENLYAELAFQ